ncbi:uncharacterized protein LOC142776319 isoform X3 [Rhipicephalus microplus]|uniref:uncharacterized protein LOC142776319 isoform X3 n=1 Tax=Rhipicephalus microplus TaxID=6941 RepID=UPI003F6D9EEC
MCDSVPGVHRGLHLFRLPLSLAAVCPGARPCWNTTCVWESTQRQINDHLENITFISA